MKNFLFIIITILLLLLLLSGCTKNNNWKNSFKKQKNKTEKTLKTLKYNLGQNKNIKSISITIPMGSVVLKKSDSNKIIIKRTIVSRNGKKGFTHIGKLKSEVLGSILVFNSTLDNNWDVSLNYIVYIPQNILVQNINTSQGSIIVKGNFNINKIINDQGEINFTSNELKQALLIQNDQGSININIKNLNKNLTVRNNQGVINIKISNQSTINVVGRNLQGNIVFKSNKNLTNNIKIFNNKTMMGSINNTKNLNSMLNINNSQGSINLTIYKAK